MPIQIGDKARSFSNPTGLLSDCHRRIEMFLRVLDRIARIIDRPLTTGDRSSLETALRYFREAAPLHTADEEESLFPRLRQMLHADVESAIERLTPLEDDHRRAANLHARVEDLGQRSLKAGKLSSAEGEVFGRTVAGLISIYTGHISLEDKLIFPLAARLLSDADKAAIAGEMATRRKVGSVPESSTDGRKRW